MIEFNLLRIKFSLLMSLMLTVFMSPKHGPQCSKPVFGIENHFHCLRNNTRGKIQSLMRIFLLHIFNLESQPALLNLNIKGPGHLGGSVG